MAVMYLAKLSMSSDIYKFYEETSLFDDYLKKVYLAINNKHTIQDEFENTYKFNSLIYDNNDYSIAGRFSKIYKGSVESYDWDKDQPINSEEKDLSSSINFYFDLNSQLISYTASRDFGYKSFLRIFKEYIESYLKDDNIKVAVELLINDEDLKKEINKLKYIEEINFTIIPPNPPNKEEFDKLFGDRAPIIYESETTQYSETYSVKNKSDNKGIKFVNYFDRIVSVIKDGYGTVSAKGVNYSNNTETISSQNNAPQKISINNKEKNNINYIKDKGKSEIIKYIGNKIE